VNDRHDLELLLRSHIPIIAIETREEGRALDLLAELQTQLGRSLYKWTVTEGLQRLVGRITMDGEHHEPGDVLAAIKRDSHSGIYALLDFHPYLDDPTHIRLVKDIALQHDMHNQRILVFISHELVLPGELSAYSARFSLSLPDTKSRETIVRQVAKQWVKANEGKRVKADSNAFAQLVDNLSGLTSNEVKRLAHKAIYDDGAITETDLPQLIEAKYRLLNRHGVLHYEFAAEKFSDVAGLERLKQWLSQRTDAFRQAETHLDMPKGILLLGVQGCGKSLAAKAVAGAWGVPLLRLDFGTLFNKFHGETERNLRETLKTADAMAPCVLWVDEIEKAVSTADNDGGTSRRVQATLLTWLAEKKSAVFLVATANDISALAPELIRKGRFDEIFFVDLPSAAVREQIFEIHLAKRGLEPGLYNLRDLAEQTEGFSGAEVEQVVVAARYSAQARGQRLDQDLLQAEIKQTRPLSVVMAERVAAIREWARDRTVSAD
jgi:SpoVK/Ycf46/Vps4 family AAA+-type ATPase